MMNEEEWRDLEHRYREHLSKKYVAYMSLASPYEMNMLAALVDGDRSKYEPREVTIGYSKGVYSGEKIMSEPGLRYSTRNREDCVDDILFEIAKGEQDERSSK